MWDLRFAVLVLLGAQGHTAAEATRALSSGPLSRGVDRRPEHDGCSIWRCPVGVKKDSWSSQPRGSRILTNTLCPAFGATSLVERFETRDKSSPARKEQLRLTPALGMDLAVWNRSGRMDMRVAQLAVWINQRHLHLACRARPDRSRSVVPLGQIAIVSRAHQPDVVEAVIATHGVGMTVVKLQAVTLEQRRPRSST